MNILTSAHALDLSGTPTVTLTMYQELVRRGHTITVYSPLGGPLAKHMQTVNDLAKTEAPEIILAQHIPCAVALKDRFPNIPLIFYCHGFVQDIEQPPPFLANHYLVINEECQQNYLNKGIPKSSITIVRDFINMDRFKPTSVINEKLTRVLFISNYKKWKNHKAVSGACEILGLELTCCGSPYGRNYTIEQEINKADLVISWARGILEAMSCARAALSFDRYEGDGYITPSSYYEARQDNFSGRHFNYAFDANSLAQEMKKYDPNCGIINRELIAEHHNVITAVDQIIHICRNYI